MSPDTQSPDIFSVSRLNSEIRAVIDGSFPLLWISGEISNLARPRSGHLYFSLKDAHAQVRCAMFRNRRILLRTQPNDGDEVLLRARVSVYEPRGDLQLIVEHMEPAGEGALQQQFERLKQKLAAEGLFDQQRKQALPGYPGSIGIVTSPQGAAVHDVLHVLQRRFPGANVIIYPTAVQGATAPTEIIQALHAARHRAETDVLILTRGGGSLEDLMAFNDEQVAREIADMPIPVVSAIGHEVDFTIADFVADQRAPTPSSAAEIVVPEQAELKLRLDSLLQRIQRSIKQRLQLLQAQLQHAAQRLDRQHPSAQLRQQQQRLDEQEMRLKRAWTGRSGELHGKIRLLDIRLLAQSPLRQLKERNALLSTRTHRMQIAMASLLKQKKQALLLPLKQLDALSPLAVLARGYSVTQDVETGKVVHSAREIQPGDRIMTRFASGKVVSRVESSDQE